MALERTFSIIKPDATRRNLTGAIVDRLEKAGLRVVEVPVELPAHFFFRLERP